MCLLCPVIPSLMFLQLQDEVLVSDAERLRMTQANVKLVSSKTFSSRHSPVDPKIETERTSASKASTEGRKCYS
ncbi:hypothetical protein BHE74_00016125 [Ensete ventricosum]|nr:hypothetical protein GW17_00041969 [Ensete ventricosum]RWW75826.1 hypothetical protein BHE74_00016125 [Ensete ventricosum]